MFEGPGTRGTKFKDRHAFKGAVMRPPLWRDLRHVIVLDAELFTQQGTFFVKPVVLSRESHTRMDAIGGPGTRAHDSIVGQCDCMEYRRFNAILPALRKINSWWLRFGKYRDLRKRVLSESNVAGYNSYNGFRDL